MQKFREGFYAYIEFNADGAIVKAMKEMLHLEGRVIRYLITAVPKAKMEEDKRKAREGRAPGGTGQKESRSGVGRGGNRLRRNRPRGKPQRSRPGPRKPGIRFQATPRK